MTVSPRWAGLAADHALATAALLPGRCVAALSLAGIAPYDADGLDYLAGMGDDNVAEFGAALDGPDSLQAFLDEACAGLTDVTSDDVVATMSSLLPEVDRAHLTGPGAEHLAAELRWSVAAGYGAGSTTMSRSSNRGTSASSTSPFRP